MKKVVYEINEENLNILILKILGHLNNVQIMEEDKYLNIEELGELIGYKKTSIYGLVQRNKIPYHKKGKLFFLKSEIMQWLKNGKKTTAKDIQRQADEYLIKNRFK